MRQRAIRGRAGAQHLQRQFDHGFGIGPRHQRRGRQCQRQSPEFLVAENARDRLAAEAAAREILQPVRFVRGELPAGGRDQAGEVEAEHGADQQSRIEFG